MILDNIKLNNLNIVVYSAAYEQYSHYYNIMIAKDITLEWYNSEIRKGFIIVKNPKLFDWFKQNKSFVQYTSKVTAEDWKLILDFSGKPELETEFIIRWL